MKPRVCVLISSIFITMILIVWLPPDGLAGTVIYEEEFLRYGTFSDPRDWEDTGPFSSFNENDLLFFVNGFQFSTDSASPDIHSHYVGGDCMKWYDYELTGQMKMVDAGASSIGQSA